MSRPHLLYVAWGFPPCRGAGVYRALATANAFALKGWDVTVLTAPRELFEDFYGADPSLEALVHPSIVVRRVRQTMPLMEFDLARYSRGRVTSEALWSSVVRRLQTVPFPERSYGPWRKHLESATLAIHADRAVDLVLGTSNPHIDFLPGGLLNRRFDVPYAMDYRDAWALNVESGARDSAPGSRDWRIERALLTNAQEVWFVNEPIRDWYQDASPELQGRTHVVMNGYDGDIGEEIDTIRLAQGRGSTPDSDEPLTFGFLGSIYGATPLAEMLAGWRRARERSTEVARARLVLRGHLGHYGVPEETFVAELNRYREDGVSYLGPVRRQAIAEAYAQFDVLTLPLRGGRYITSGKVFEYAATGLPIVSIHSTELHANTLMQDSPSWTLAQSMSPDDVASALIRGAEMARASSDESVRATRAWATRFARDAQLRPRVDALTAAVCGADQPERRAPHSPARVASSATTRSTNPVHVGNRPADARRGPQDRVVLLVGSDEPADVVLQEAGVTSDLATSLGKEGQPATIMLVCRRAPLLDLPGVDQVHVVAQDRSLASRVHRSAAYGRLTDHLSTSVPGRVLASLSPADETRTFWRSVRDDPAIARLVDGADIAVAVDRPAVRAAWQWLRRGLVPVAVFSIQAAERRARR